MQKEGVLSWIYLLFAFTRGSTQKPEYIAFPYRLKKSRFILPIEKADFEARKICLFYGVLPDDGAAPPTPNEILLWSFCIRGRWKRPNDRALYITNSVWSEDASGWRFFTRYSSMRNTARRDSAMRYSKKSCPT